METAYNLSAEALTLHALHNIAAGTELTVDYIKGCKVKSARAELLEDLGFTCDCHMCDRTNPQFAASKRRRARKLKGKLPDVDEEDDTDPKAVPRTVAEIVELMDMAGLAVRKIRKWYQVAARNCAPSRTQEPSDMVDREDPAQSGGDARRGSRGDAEDFGEAR